MAKSFIVIGAGLGGLATALRLSHLGHRVTVLEKTDQVGGRNRREAVGACEFDAGPTLLMMLDPFRKLFADVGERFEDHLIITRCDPSYRVFYADGTRLDPSPDVNKMQAELSRIGEEASKYPAFLARLAALYESSIPHFVRKNYYSPWDFMSPPQVARVLKHGMLGNLARKVERTFRDERLRMLFSFQTMYLGLSPYEAPWVYSTLAYMEHGEGIWYPQGGLPRISEVVADLARSRGAEIRLESPVAAINGNTVRLESGETATADCVIANADLPYVKRELERKASRRRLKSSCSVYVLYLDYEGQLPDLLHHNVVFGKDFRGNLDDLFHRLKLADDPAFYVCASNRSEPARAPDGHENLMILVPVPNLGHPFSDADGAQVRSQVYDRLEREVGFDRSRIVDWKARSPREWKSELNLDLGAAFGIGHQTMQSAFMRPGNRSRSNPYLYYVGASTTPGNGLPMVLISAELLEDRLVHDGVIERGVVASSRLAPNLPDLT